MNNAIDGMWEKIINFMFWAIYYTILYINNEVKHNSSLLYNFYVMWGHRGDLIFFHFSSWSKNEGWVSIYVKYGGFNLRKIQTFAVVVNILAIENGWKLEGKEVFMSIRHFQSLENIQSLEL